MQELTLGSRLQTGYGRTVVVLRELGAGGQGIVYKVSYGTEQKALKWYFVDKIADRGKFADNLRHNIMQGAPTTDFIWPIDFVETQGGGLGYVMDLRPSGYYEAGDILIDPSRYSFSFKRAVDACLNIVTAFRMLHNSGYWFEDVTDGNFLIDSKTGKVLVFAIENVATEGMSTGMMGHPDFRVPEIMGEVYPLAPTEVVLAVEGLILRMPGMGENEYLRVCGTT